MRHPARGLGAIAAIVVLVVLAVLAASILRLSGAQQHGQTQDLLAARAAQAAQAGLEWGLYQALRGSWSTCGNVSRTIDLVAESGMRVTVNCRSSTYREGETSPGVARTVRVYTLDAVACNAPTACPDAARAVTPGYVERRRQVHATGS